MQLLRPYFRDVVEIARRVEALKKQKPWMAPQFVAADSLAFVHYPIKDLGIGEDESVSELCAKLPYCKATMFTIHVLWRIDVRILVRDRLMRCTPLTADTDSEVGD
jgi:hypothetical protein